MDLIGVLVFFLLTLIFYLFRRIAIYNVLALAVVTGFVLFTWRWVEWRSVEEFLLMSGGQALYWFGLLVVRVMLKRSVSLRLLSSIEGGGRAETIAAEVAARVEDAKRYALVRELEGKYSLTSFGQLIQWVVRVSYLALRIH